MPDQTRLVAPGPRLRTVKTTSGQILEPPADWDLLPPGDAGLTRRVKAGGPTWTVQEKKGRKLFSYGVWAPRERIEAVRAALAAERSTEKYAKTKAASSRRRERQQTEYVGEFHQAILEFLAFPSCHGELATQIAQAVAAHATPVGSGTVARTQRIPIEQRAEAAVIAWMRHQTTAYDQLQIPRVKGERREVRRLLAAQSRLLLRAYRAGEQVPPEECLLWKAVGGKK